MSSLSRLANSFISATNENTLAFANFNFDFSLVKLEAPQEFVPLGSALSTERRSNAEDGALHQLARKVGTLFEQVIPSTPKLLKAYGCRASEIVEAPGVNPKRSRDDGPFESFVGSRRYFCLGCCDIWSCFDRSTFVGVYACAYV